MTSEEEFLAEKLGRKTGDVPTGLLALLKHIETHADFYQVMLGPTGDPLMVQRLRKNTERRFYNLLANYATETDADAPPLDLRVSYIAYAGVGAIKWWVEHRNVCTPEQLARWLGQLSSASAGLPLAEYMRRANAGYLLDNSSE
jgi:hypothetical protein